METQITREFKTEDLEKIIIIDFGGQYAHLIANRVRRLGVLSEIYHDDIEIQKLKAMKNLKGIILSGGPNSTMDEGAPQLNKEFFDLKVPVLGLCYGHQSICKIFGGKIVPGTTKEYGVAVLNLTNKSELFAGLESSQKIWMSHGDSVGELPQGFEIIGETESCKIAATQNIERQIFSLQFHPEVTHTVNGIKMIENFVQGICKCSQSWDPKMYTSVIQSETQQQIASKSASAKVFTLVSGGVDSTVAFTLLNKALGQEKNVGLFIDNGLLRKGEFEFVCKAIKDLGYDNFYNYNGSEQFLEELKEVYEPEEKRKIIGRVFLEVQKKALKDMNLNPSEWLLGQGTIYPDTIESKGSKHADLIKTHHNRVEQIQKMIEEGNVVEPLQNLYKDEVRAMGLELGLPQNLIWRHPFPGPGLGVRCLCSSTNVLDKEYLDSVEKVNKQLTSVAQKDGLKGSILPVKSVGVQGDQRTYRHPAALHYEDIKSKFQVNGVECNEFWNRLEEYSTLITNTIDSVNRVILLVKSKNYGKFAENDNENVGLKKEYINKKRVQLLQEADAITMEMLAKYDLMGVVWQCPTVLIPIGQDKCESIVLRPVFSQEAMTAEFGKISFEIVEKIAEKILELEGISEVYYDITNKPPGTIEWE